MFTLRRLSYLFFVTCAAYTAHYFLHTPETAWLIPVTFTLALVTAGRTLYQRELALLLMGLALMMTSILSAFLVDNHLLLLGYLIIFMLLYMRFVYKRLLSTRVFVLFVFLTIIFSSRYVSHESDLERVGIISLSVVIAMAAQLLFWPILFKDNISRAITMAVIGLRGTNKAIFDCLLSPDYKDDIYNFERDIHINKRQFLGALTVLRQSSKDRQDHTAWQHILNERITLLESIFENMLDYAQIRWRIADHSSYSLCTSELQHISTAFDRIIVDLKSFLVKTKPTQMEIQTAEARFAVEKLNSIYQTVLKTTVREPLAIFLFLASLNGFIDTVTIVGGL